MGMHPNSTLPYMCSLIKHRFGKFKNLSMIELGNQIIRKSARSSGKTGKEYFTDLGVIHTSIDLNAKDGALKLDLCSEITDIEPVDVVTNFGTSEHVNNQNMCFKNIHNFCKEGGMMVHFVPPVGAWPGHCLYWYTIDFFKQLADANNYEILKNEIFDDTNTHGMIYVGARELLMCILVKSNSNDFNGLN